MELLSDEVKNIDSLLNNNSLKLEFKLEQMINRYRVFIDSKDYEKSIYLAINIINFIIDNENSEDIPKDNIEYVKKENLNNYLNWVNYLINNIISKIEFNKDISDEKKKKFIMLFSII